MRDPMAWALPVFRAFGIQVKVHLFFFLITLGLFLRQVTAKDNPIAWFDVFAFTVLLLFFIILLHEFGHCFGARWVDGDAKEILIWPLGGLAYVEVPNHWKPNFLVTAAGPATNVVICLFCAAALMLFGHFVPSLNPVGRPYTSEMYNYRDGRTYTSEYGLKLYKPGSAEPIPEQEAIDKSVKNDEGWGEKHVFNPKKAEEWAAKSGGQRALAPGWAVWLNRAFYLSWVLFLFNLLPAYPLDGGQMLMAAVWGRTSYRQGVVVAAYSGIALSVVFLIVAIAVNEVLFMMLGLFMLQMSWLKLQAQEVEEGPFGYDFSAGYTSLERDEKPPPRKRKRAGFLARWWQVRKVRKLQREVVQRQQDEERMDQLLEKIARSGKESLTEEERRFLQQASTRYRNRS